MDEICNLIMCVCVCQLLHGYWVVLGLEAAAGGLHGLQLERRRLRGVSPTFSLLSLTLAVLVRLLSRYQTATCALSYIGHKMLEEWQLQD